MASPSPIVVLPSIHEMFPEHLLTHPNATLSPTVAPLSFLPARLPPRNHFLPAPLPTPLTQPGFGFPSATQSRSRPPIRVSTALNSLPVPVRLSPTPTSSGSEGDADDIDMADAEQGRVEARKHVCPRCGKRFNRPSSLRIHVNTHTGATPFRCPHPGCGRAFNVNSNMRRHFRNHGTGALSPASPSAAASSSSSSESASPTLHNVPRSLSPSPSFTPRPAPTHLNITKHAHERERVIPAPSPGTNIRFLSPIAVPSRSPRSSSPRSAVASWDPEADDAQLRGYSESAVRGEVLSSGR